MASAYVTGIAGFLGSHVAKALVAKGWEVSGVDNLVTGNPANPPDGARWTLMDLADLDEVPDVDVVFHLAAISRSAWPRPVDLWNANCGATSHLLELVPGRKVVFASSCVVVAPFDSTYALTKSLSERAVLDAGGRALRFANLYGDGQSQEGPAPNVLAAMARSARTEGKVVVHGGGYQTRDFVHVVDAAEACLITAAGLGPAHGDWADVCSGIQTPIIDLAYRFGVPVVQGPSRFDAHHYEQNPDGLPHWRATRRIADWVPLERLAA